MHILCIFDVVVFDIVIYRCVFIRTSPSSSRLDGCVSLEVMLAFIPYHLAYCPSGAVVVTFALGASYATLG